jgi:cell division protein ZapA (FtsZ GTPase activity inhibitor)
VGTRAEVTADDRQPETDVDKIASLVGAAVLVMDDLQALSTEYLKTAMAKLHEEVESTVADEAHDLRQLALHSLARMRQPPRK